MTESWISQASWFWFFLNHSRTTCLTTNIFWNSPEFQKWFVHCGWKEVSSLNRGIVARDMIFWSVAELFQNLFSPCDLTLQLEIFFKNPKSPTGLCLDYLNQKCHSGLQKCKLLNLHELISRSCTLFVKIWSVIIGITLRYIFWI